MTVHNTIIVLDISLSLFAMADLFWVHFLQLAMNAYLSFMAVQELTLLPCK